jgi:predicted dehydrogenase
VKKDKLRVGVIGVGRMGEYHIQKYKAMPMVELVGVADTNLHRCNELAALYGTNAFNGYHNLLDKVDAVSVAVPTETHFEVAKDVLSKGIHILLEKPITYELGPADALIDIARKNNLVFQVGLVERFNPAVIKMGDLLDQPILLESHRMNVFTTRGIDVDVVLDLMFHDLDIILHSVDSEVKEVHSTGMSVITGKTDVANARLVFENGVAANLTASRVADKTLRKIRVFQPSAYLSVNCLKKEISVIRLDEDMKGPEDFPKLTSHKTSFSDCDPLADEISAFVGSVMGGRDPVVTGGDARKALKIALGIIDQIERGCNNFQSID